MVRNYFRIAWRNLIKSKGYSLINISGLGVGMAVAILIGLWIWDEISFDTYHKNLKSLGQIAVTQTFNGVVETGSSVAVPLENELRVKYSSDFKDLSLFWESTNILATGDKKLSGRGMWAQAGLPDMFTLEMIYGNASTFKDASTVLLSRSVATALFGQTDPTNKTVRVDNKTDMKVGGVYRDLPRNTTLTDIKFLLPWDNKANRWNTQTAAWDNHGSSLFIQLNEHADFAKTTEKIKNIPKEHLKVGNEEIMIHPMSKWHLYSQFENGKAVGGRIEFVWLFGIIGIFVLLLACINFMNLSTARSEKRAKEVGIRKAIGSLRGQLIGQFLSESLLVALMALVLAVVLARISLSFFNSIADKQIAVPWFNPVFWLLVLAFTLFTGLLAGSYPAFYLSGFSPVSTLKGSFRAGRHASLPRKVLVVLQFTVSVTLIISTIIVFKQVQFAKGRPVGYSREGLITVVMNTPELYQHYNGLRDDLIATGAVENMAESNSSATEIWSSNYGFDWKGKAPDANPLFGTLAVTHDFGKTVGWKIIDGRDFSRNFSTDTGAFILNEAAVKLSGLKHPVGQIMKWNGKDHLIVGVVKDMVMESPYKPTVATVFHMQYSWANLITVKIKPAMPMQKALAQIESVFKKYNPGSPFEYKFIDDEYARKFAEEQRVGNLAAFFATLAIFISCLGLLGLASFVAEQRKKEIGVRKVLGASVLNIWQMLSKDFVGLVIISCFVAIPFTWHFLNQWLQRYQYRTEISWWIFAASITGAIFITLLTVSFQTIKTALTNPVKSIRTE
ncbi:ABC transporter permease [Mucilaginibacter calamicampi]|uniref:ABC transporter permease n=1 Tax=Mucilaginibacter calamicampi TaxID=1302352 RepID=A0ABW2YX37_9SPHI